MPIIVTNWKSAVSGSWNTAGLWSAGSPSAGSNAVIAAIGAYTVTVGASSTAYHANSLDFDGAGGLLSIAAGASLDIAQYLTVNSGMIQVNGTVAADEAAIYGGVLALGRSGALGAAPLYIVNGMLLADGPGVTEFQPSREAYEASPNGGGSNIVLYETVTIAAAAGSTLDFNPGTGWDYQEPQSALNGTMYLGTSQETGTVIWHTKESYIAAALDRFYSVEIGGGTVKGGDDHFDYVFGYANGVFIDAGATLDLAGHSIAAFQDGSNQVGGPILHLSSKGVITNSSSTLATLDVANGTISGGIKGNVALDIAAQGSVSLSGSNSFSGGVTVNGTLQLLGSITSTVTDGSTGLVTLLAGASLPGFAAASTGEVMKSSVGTSTVTGHSTNAQITTDIDAGTLAINQGDSLGSTSAEIDIGNATGGRPELLANQSLTVAPQVHLSLAGETFSAVTGQSMTLTNMTIVPHFTDTMVVHFGTAAHAGTVIIASQPDFGGPTDFDVDGGTLRASGSAFDPNVAGTLGVTVAKGATFDLGGQVVKVALEEGTGTVGTSSGGTLDLSTESFAGHLTGTISTQISTAQLFGLTDYSGTTQVGGNIVNLGTFIMKAAITDAVPNSGAFFDNESTFEVETGSLQTIAPDFTNYGTLRAISGSVQFEQLVNLGLIQGALQHMSDGSWKLSANQAGQSTYFGGGLNTVLALATAPTYFDGGSGIDTLVLTKPMTLVAGSLVSVEDIKVDNGVTANLAALSTTEVITLASVANAHTSVTGTQAGDNITGGAGLDTINGGGGNDTMTGGAGNDTYDVNSSGDKVVEAVNGGTDTVYSAISFTLAPNVENLATTSAGGTGAINLTGNTLGNGITGNAGNNILTGGTGADVLIGGGGHDTLVANTTALSDDSARDTFKFISIADGGTTAATEDIIYGTFTGGTATGDKIDLSAIPTGTGAAAFTFIGAAAFSTNHPGQVRVIAGTGTDHIVQVNTNSDAAAEMTILVHATAHTFAAGDFVL